MVTQNKRIERICSFYVSDFHLEMILLPYINEKIDNKEEVTILTEKNLEETLKILLSKMNIKEENKQKILELGWSGEEKIKENANVIIIGSESYIKEKNEQIEDAISILDCYDFEKVKDNIDNITNKYEKRLNTLGKNNF